MASILTTFQTPSQIDSAITTLNSGFSLDSTLATAQTLYAIIENGVYQYTYTSSNQVNIRFSNGNTAELYGSNLTGNTPYMTRLDFHTTSGLNVSLYGGVTEPSGSYASGKITQVSMSQSGHGTINVYGSFDVSQIDGTVSKIVWDVGGAHLEENGQLQASIWLSGGYYYASHAGGITSGVITANGLSFQASGMNVDSNTLPASAIQAILNRPGFRGGRLV